MLPLAECPVCYQPLRWTYMLRPLWSQWHCEHCGSLLGINVKRRLLGIALFLPAVLLVTGVLARMPWGALVIAPVVLAIWGPLFLLLDRAVVIERCGLRCQQCGYDLRGQTAPRCPECGETLDAIERARLAAGVGAAATRPPRRHLPTVVALAISVTALLCLSLLFTYRQAMRTRAARRPTAAVQTTRSAVPVSASQPASAPVAEGDEAAHPDGGE